jgi:hypothetical protein
MFATVEETTIDQQFNDIANGIATTNEPKKANHQANIIRVSEILPHPDPETTNLELIHIDGYQVVVRKGDFKVGDLAIYIQPDSIVPQTDPFKFIWGEYVGIDGKVPEKRRRITVRKFRGQWSEGLLLPLGEFATLATGPVIGGNRELYYVSEGDDVSGLLGITHYDPDAGKENVEGTKGASVNAPRHKYPKTLKGWFFFLLHKITGRGHKNFAQEVSFNLPVYDVDALKRRFTVPMPGSSSLME